MSQQNLRNEFLTTLAHIGGALTKVTANSGPGKILSAPDLHKLAEGLFLSSWTHWEEFIHYLLVEDLATGASTMLHREIRHFRYRGSAWRLANQVLSHTDSKRFIEWSEYGDVISRANEFLGAGNRFAASPLPRRSDLDLLKKVRNAVAHRSDRAWKSFMGLCRNQPFALPAAQMRGITPGRFLVAHHWNGQPVLRDAISMLDGAARHLVP